MAYTQASLSGACCTSCTHGGACSGSKSLADYVPSTKTFAVVTGAIVLWAFLRRKR